MLTLEQIEMLNNMCFGANEVSLGTLLQQLQEETEKAQKIIWYNFDGTPTEKITK